METLGKIITAIILAVIGIILGGFIFMKVWIWFITPVFTELPVLNLAQSIGVATFGSMVWGKRPKTDENKEFSDVLADWFGNLFYVLFMFGAAWIIHLFIA